MSAVSPRPSYAAVLRIPHARRTFAAALAARLSYGMLPLAVMLCVTRATGSYAVAGVVMAVFGAMVVLLSPYRAALVDRGGVAGGAAAVVGVLRGGGRGVGGGGGDRVDGCGSGPR